MSGLLPHRASERRAAQPEPAVDVRHRLLPVVTSLLALPTAGTFCRRGCTWARWSSVRGRWLPPSGSTLRDPQLRGELPPPGSRSIATAIAGAVLYGLAFLVGMLISAAGHPALFLLMATFTAVRIVAKRLDARKARASRPTTPAASTAGRSQLPGSPLIARNRDAEFALCISINPSK